MQYIKRHVEYLDCLNKYDTFEELVDAAEAQGACDGTYTGASFNNYEYKKYSDLTSNQFKLLKTAYQKGFSKTQQQVKSDKEKKSQLLTNLFYNNKELLKSLVALGIIEERVFKAIEATACSQH